MIARILNLLLALAVAWPIPMMALTGWSEGDASLIPYLLFVACWLSSAIGLFFGKRIAWWGSLLCAGVVLMNSLELAWRSWKLTQSKEELSAGAGFTHLSAFLGLTVSLVAILGLMHLRKEMAGKWK